MSSPYLCVHRKHISYIYLYNMCAAYDCICSFHYGCYFSFILLCSAGRLCYCAKTGRPHQNSTHTQAPSTKILVMSYVFLVFFFCLFSFFFFPVQNACKNVLSCNRLHFATQSVVVCMCMCAMQIIHIRFYMIIIIIWHNYVAKFMLWAPDG